METLDKAYYEANPNVICKDPAMLQPVMQTCVALLQKQFPCKLVETWRSNAREQMLFAQGKSHTHNSLHSQSLAVDVYPLPDGYNIDSDGIDKLHTTWRAIAVGHGYPQTAFAGFDPLHCSLNNGTHI